MWGLFSIMKLVTCNNKTQKWNFSREQRKQLEIKNNKRTKLENASDGRRKTKQEHDYTLTSHFISYACSTTC